MSDNTDDSSGQDSESKPENVLEKFNKLPVAKISEES